ncbi:hypothetical protein BHMPCIPO_04803 [Ensifer sesbaniae]|nr:hypothetical protein [Ensifer sesbaniae]
MHLHFSVKYVLYGNLQDANVTKKLNMVRKKATDVVPKRTTIRVAYKGMEKARPTYDLEAIKVALGSTETLAMTSSALRDAMALASIARAWWKRSPGWIGGCFISR